MPAPVEGHGGKYAVEVWVRYAEEHCNSMIAPIIEVRIIDTPLYIVSFKEVRALHTSRITVALEYSFMQNPRKHWL